MKGSKFGLSNEHDADCTFFPNKEYVTKMHFCQGRFEPVFYCFKNGEVER